MGRGCHGQGGRQAWPSQTRRGQRAGQGGSFGHEVKAVRGVGDAPVGGPHEGLPRVAALRVQRFAGQDAVRRQGVVRRHQEDLPFVAGGVEPGRHFRWKPQSCLQRAVRQDRGGQRSREIPRLVVDVEALSTGAQVVHRHALECLVVHLFAIDEGAWPALPHRVHPCLDVRRRHRGTGDPGQAAPSPARETASDRHRARVGPWHPHARAVDHVGELRQREVFRPVPQHHNRLRLEAVTLQSRTSGRCRIEHGERVLRR